MSLDGWSDLVTVYARRSGDCKDFVAIRLAEEWLAGDFQVFPLVTHKEIRDPQTGKIYNSFHVQLSDGTGIEDPSAALGMPQRISIEDVRQMFR